MNKEKRALTTYNDVMVKIAASKKRIGLPNLDETERTYKGDLNIRILSELEKRSPAKLFSTSRGCRGLDMTPLSANYSPSTMATRL